MKKKIVCIVGPTASGKTRWGVFVAKKFDGEIISADSRQIYRGLDIGTGKEGDDSKLKSQNSKLELKIQNSEKLLENIRWAGGVPQWLIDICNPGEKFTMFDWLAAARKVIEDIFARGKIPIVVGGTGLYIQALIEGFTLNKTNNEKLITNNHNSKLKNFSREELEKRSLKELQKIFRKLAASSLQLTAVDLNNPHRLIRAIERAQAGEIVTKKGPDFEALEIIIDLPREKLYQRIDQRVENWFEQGFIKETQGLLDSGVSPKWLEKIGLEYRILTDFLIKNPKLKIPACAEALAGRQMSNLPRRQAGEDQNTNTKFAEMKQRMKYAIHAYARRQLTWFRRFPEIIRCRNLKSAEEEIKKFLL